MSLVNPGALAPEVRRAMTAIDADVSSVTTRVAALETTTTPSAWTAATLNSPWVTYSAGFRSARYRKIGDIVYVEGLVKSGSSGSTIFTLPSGFRPPEHIILPTITDPNVFGRLDVSTAGAVIWYASGTGTSAYVSINCSFSTV